MQNYQKPPSQKKREEETREKTAREKALEFAKNVPKPKRRTEVSESEPNNNEINQDLGHIAEEDYDEYGNTLIGGDLAALNLKHD